MSSQRRRGLTSGRVQVGDHVRAAGWPSTRRPGYLQVNHILPPDGTELLVGRIREPRWSETHLGSGEWTVDPATAASATGTGSVSCMEPTFRRRFLFSGVRTPTV